MKFIASIFAFIFCYGCSRFTQDKTAYKWEKDSLIIKWKIDSDGCKNYRNDARIDSIFTEYDFASKSIDSVKMILGKPNDELDNEAYHDLRYFYGTVCINDTLMKEGDKCWIDILFPKNKKELNSLSGACE